MSFFAELRQRNVLRAAAAYAAFAWLLIQVGEATFPAFGFGDRAQRYLVIALVIGLVPVVALAWAFELTPAGFRRERDVDRGSALARRTNRLFDRLIMVVLAIGITYFAVDKFLIDPARDEAQVAQALEQGRSEALIGSYAGRSIVVLPFANLSSDPEQEFFSDGMAEEVLNLLARIPELRVISRTSAFAFKGRDMSLREIAQQLEVSHVLEGSVRRSGDRLRITAQLIDARTDAHLWSATYDRRLEDIFAIQDDIAAQVVAELELRLLDEAPRARRTDPQAYVLYMQARQLLDVGDRDYGRIHAILRRALEIDPQYADAWTGISWLYFRYRVEDAPREIDFFRSLTADEADRLGREAREKALGIDPDNAIAVAYAAFDTAFVQRDFAAAAPQFARAIRLDPTKSDVLRPSMIFARAIDRPEVAIRLGEFAIARDPLCSQCAWNLARAYLEAGRLDEAEATMRNFAVTGRGGWHTIGSILLLKGDARSALETFEQLPEDMEPDRLHGRALALHALGRHEESRAALETLQSRWGQVRPELIAQVHAWTGGLDQAEMWLERALDSLRHIPAMPFDWRSPFLRPLLEQPRGQQLLRRVGAAPEQLAEIRFEVRLPGESTATARAGGAG